MYISTGVICMASIEETASSANSLISSVLENSAPAAQNSFEEELRPGEIFLQNHKNDVSLAVARMMIENIKKESNLKKENE
jgi:hypothetical protein